MATVSRVVNGNPNVKPLTRKKVLETIRRMGYRPNAVARGLASKKTTTVGVVIPDISYAFFAELTRGIEDIANMYHYNIILCNSDLKKNKELQLIEALFEKQVDGLLFLGGEVTEEHREIFSGSDIPVVLAATQDEKVKNRPFVTIDHVQAAKEATGILIREGHQRIGFVGGPLTDPIIGYPRYLGYKEALSESGLPFEEKWIQLGNYRYDTGLKATKELLMMEEGPTAIFAVNDEIAVGAIHAAQDLGKRVPEEISVIGFDNIPLATQVRPLLSTVAVPMYDIGAVAMRLLTKYMNGEPIENNQVVLEYRLELRDSTQLKETPDSV